MKRAEGIIANTVASRFCL